MRNFLITETQLSTVINCLRLSRVDVTFHELDTLINVLKSLPVLSESHKENPVVVENATTPPIVNVVAVNE